MAFRQTTPRSIFNSSSSPGVNSDLAHGYELGSFWLDQTDLQLFICEDNTNGAAVWLALAPADAIYLLGAADARLPNAQDISALAAGYAKVSGGIVSSQAVPIPVTDGGTGSTVALQKALFDHFADANNTGTGETDLYTDTLAAGLLAGNGDKVLAQYGGIFTGAAAATQDLRVYFGGTAIYDSGALSIGVATDNWTVYVTIIRESSSIVRCNVSVNSDFATLFPYSKYTRITGLTLANTQILKITGQAGGAGGGSNQITAKEGYAWWLKAA